jgi:hypothetical protein
MASVASDVRIGVLGPLEVRVGFGEPVEMAGPRLRTLLIRLALDLAAACRLLPSIATSGMSS